MQIIKVVAIYLYLISPLWAGPITQSIDIDLIADGRIYTTSDNEWWEGIVPIAPLTLTEGNSYLFELRFKDNLAIELTHSDTFSDELSKLSLLPSSPTNISWRSSGIISYLGVDGELLSNTVVWDINGGGGAYQGPFVRNNLTDTSFLYSGVDILFNLDSYTINSGIAEFNELEWSSSAGKVKITHAVPLPPSFLLVLLGMTVLNLLHLLRN